MAKCPCPVLVNFVYLLHLFQRTRAWKASHCWIEATISAGVCNSCSPFFLARCCLGQVPGGAPFSQRSKLATACTNRMQINLFFCSMLSNIVRESTCTADEEHEQMKTEGMRGNHNQQVTCKAIRKLKLARCPGFVEPKQLIQIWDLVKSRIPEFAEPKQLVQTRILVTRARLTAKRSVTL